MRRLQSECWGSENDEWQLLSKDGVKRIIEFQRKWEKETKQIQFPLVITTAEESVVFDIENIGRGEEKKENQNTEIQVSWAN